MKILISAAGSLGDTLPYHEGGRAAAGTAAAGRNARTLRTVQPQLAAFVHHGGIGTTSQALRTGVPQLVRPMAYDQFDNAHHVQRLGVGARLLPAAYAPPAVAQALAHLIGDRTRHARCAEVAALCRADGDAVSAACDAVLRLADVRR